jgi:four helix bundle protein
MPNEKCERDIHQRAFEFACRIVHLHDWLCRRKGAARSLARQVLRAGTSIGANLEEANAAQSKPDFISKCSIAAKEARETHYWLRLLVASNRVSESKLCPMVQEASEIVAILTTIIKNAGKTKLRS